MSISDEAVEAVAQIAWERFTEDDYHPMSWELAKAKYAGGTPTDLIEDAKRGLEAAAPYMLAAAYEADAKALAHHKTRNPFAWYVARAMSAYLRTRAADIRSGK